MSDITHDRIRQGKRRIERRLAERSWEAQDQPMLSGTNIHYEISGRMRGLDVGGIGAIHSMVNHVGLASAIDDRLKLLKIHVPYHDSDHVLTAAYNTLCGGTCLEDIELRRTNEAFLNALGAQRIPDPTTVGDYCRRFSGEDVDALMAAINETRLSIWQAQPEAFRDHAIVDADGTHVPTYGECKEGMEMAYDGQWGYHPLVLSLANTAEPLFIVNRGGARPSHEGAADRFNQSLDLLQRAGFRKVSFRGDTDFSQTKHLDGWNEKGVVFVFGFDAIEKLQDQAATLPEEAWQALTRPPRYEIKTEPRAERENIKDRIVQERGYRNLHLLKEEVAEFDYKPGACRQAYRMVAVRKTISVEEGQRVLFPERRYLFYITNDRTTAAGDLVLFANDRCDQENLHAQLKAIRALRSPLDTMVSNWAYMVMTALAWSLKAWFALELPVHGRWRERHEAEKQTLLRMEFRTFLHAIIRIPTQVIRTGRKIVMRVLGWNRWLGVLFRGLKPLPI